MDNCEKKGQHHIHFIEFASEILDLDSTISSSQSSWVPHAALICGASKESHW
ncbi:hypothetical protein KI387_010618, partial [Taxus chinensis]